MLKRKLAALLAGAMVLTSLPMVSFAEQITTYLMFHSKERRYDFQS